jgi:hypothetical protein
MDPPVFVDVGQIVAGYTLESGLTAGASLPENSVAGGNTAQLGGTIKYTDRPTITYSPMTGDRFVKALMTPLPPESVFFTVESGWPADAILFTAVAEMNELRNQVASISGLTAAEPEFMQALKLIQRIQDQGGVGMRVEMDEQDRPTTLVTLRSRRVTDQTMDDSRELRRLLGLAPDGEEFKLVFGRIASGDRELAVQTRSLLHILGILAAQVEVPVEHVAEGRATPGIREAEQEGSQVVRLARIHSSNNKPDDAYVAIHYKDQWFYIDDTDLKSKRTFAFMMLLFTLSDSGEKQNLPLITIPTQ